MWNRGEDAKEELFQRVSVTVDFLVLETAGIETDIQIAQFPYAYLETR